MAKTELTLAQKYDEVMALVSDEVFSDGTLVADFLADRKAKLTKKSSGKTVAQKEADKKLANEVLSILSTEGKTVTAVLKALDNDAISSSKVTYILRSLVDEGKAINTKDKKTSLYSLA